MQVVATDFLKEIAWRMRDPLKLKELATEGSSLKKDEAIASSIWSDLSLASGYPGILLLFAELDREFPSEGWDEIVHAYVLEIKRVIEIQGGTHSYSLFSGLAGICFALSLGSREHTRYDKMWHKLHSFLLQGVRSEYVEPLRENVRQKVSSSPHLFDLMQGVSGVLLYLLDHIHDQETEALVSEILKSLIDFILPITIQGFVVPGWYVSQKDQFLEEEKKLFPNGNFNLGLSHGAPGILGILSLAALKGIEVEGQQEAIDEIASWIVEKRQFDRTRFFWGGQIPFEEEVGQIPAQLNWTRDAWCYGVPGVSSALLLASKARGRKDWEEIAADTFVDVFLVPVEKWHIPSPTFCHGLAGMHKVVSFISQNIHDEEAKLFLKDRLEWLTDLLIAQGNPEHPFAFQDLTPKDQKLVAIDNPGLLEGATGTLLALLDPWLTKGRWDQVFLLNHHI